MKDNRTKLAIYFLLGLYGLVLVVLSVKVFMSPSQINKLPEVKSVAQQQEPKLSPGVLAVRPDGRVSLDTGDNNVVTLQVSLILPYKNELKDIKGLWLDKNLSAAYNKTTVDKANNRIVVNMAAYSLTGYRTNGQIDVAELQVAGKPIPKTNIGFDKPLVKVIALKDGKSVNVPMQYTQ